MTQAIARRDAPFDAVALYTFTGLATLGALLATAFSNDPLFRFAGWTMFVGLLVGFLGISVGLGQGRFRSDPTRYADGVIRAGVIATMFWAQRSSAGRTFSTSPMRRG